jgi:hypothetical protein
MSPSGGVDKPIMRYMTFKFTFTEAETRGFKQFKQSLLTPPGGDIFHERKYVDNSWAIENW